MIAARLPERCVILVVVLGALVFALGVSADDAKLGLRGGYYTDAAEPFLGAELLARVAPALYFNPNVEYVFISNAKYLTWNGDFHYDFRSRGSSFAWVGAGIGVSSVNPSGPNNTRTDVAANFLAGIGVRSGSLIPYFQAKIIAKDDAEFALGFGVRF